MHSKLKYMNLIDAQRLAKSLMVQHGLTAWNFEFDNAYMRFGVCWHRTRRIGLSRRLVPLNSEEQVKDTILHEIAHALVGIGHGHDRVWQAMCRKIGARPERCCTLAKENTPKLKYSAKCGGCGKVHQKAKMMKNVIRSACRCQSHLPWDAKILLTYVDNKGGSR